MTGFELGVAALLVGICAVQGVMLVVFFKRGNVASTNQLESQVYDLHDQLTRNVRAEFLQLEERMRVEFSNRSQETSSAIGEVRNVLDRKFGEMMNQDRQNHETWGREFKEQDSSRQRQIEAVRALLDSKFVSFVADLEKSRTTLDTGLKEIRDKVTEIGRAHV